MLQTKSALGGLLLAAAWCVDTSASAAPPSGADAERSIAWSTVGRGDAIPALMPTSGSANSLDAGFAPEWVERSVRPTPAGEEAARWMLSIMSVQRASDDAWAEKVEHYLREFIRTQADVQAPTISRVFCNSVGCLCYLERAGLPLTTLMIYKALSSQAPPEFGIRQTSMRIVDGPRRPDISWELTIVMRPSEDAAKGSKPSGQTVGEATQH
jgi:hypothetical protein